jgi:hypothetical protein
LHDRNSNLLEDLAGEHQTFQKTDSFFSVHLEFSDMLKEAGLEAHFFQGNVMAEKCEQAGTCNVDQLGFKAYLSRWLAATSVVLPSMAGTIAPLLQASANGAVASCGGSPNSSTCGTKWFTNNWDGT